MKVKKINWIEDNGGYLSEVYFDQFRFRIYCSSIVNDYQLFHLEAIDKTSYKLYSNLFIFHKAFNLKNFTTLEIMEIAYQKLCEIVENMQENINELLED